MVGSSGSVLSSEENTSRCFDGMRGVPRPNFVTCIFFGLIGTKSTSFFNIKSERGLAAPGGVIPRDVDFVGGNGDPDLLVLNGDCESFGVEVPLKEDAENSVASVEVEKEEDAESAEEDDDDDRSEEIDESVVERDEGFTGEFGAVGTKSEPFGIDIRVDGVVVSSIR